PQEATHELLLQAQRGDEEAFFTLCIDLTARLIRRARWRNRLLSLEDAEDIVNEFLFEKLFRNVHKYDPDRAGHTGAYGWIVFIFDRFLRDKWRRANVRTHVTITDTDIADSDVETEVEEQLLVEELRRAISMLSEEEQVALLKPGAGRKSEA